MSLAVAVVAIGSATARAQPVIGRVSAEPDPAFEAFLDGQRADALARYPGRFRKQLEQRYRARDEQLLTSYAAGEFLLEPYWQQWIDSLTRAIARTNPDEVAPTQRALVGRGLSPNARCYGNEVLVVDAALVARLDSEDEVAFVICHELAHQHLRHVDAAAQRSVDYLYDKETQRQLKQLRNASAGGYDDYLALLRDLGFGTSRHGRTGEREADSLGLRLYRSLGLSASAPARVMRVLARADSLSYPDELDIVAALRERGIEPEAHWQERGPQSFLLRTDTLTAAERDSLATHPQTAERLAALLALGVRAPTAAEQLPQGAFATRRRAAQRELSAAALDRDRYDFALYHALQAARADSTDHWHHGVAALTLALVYEAREERRMTDVVPIPRRDDRGEVAPLARWLHALRGQELAEVAYTFAKATADRHETPEALLALAIVADLTPGRAAERIAARARLRQLDPRHPYLDR